MLPVFIDPLHIPANVVLHRLRHVFFFTRAGAVPFLYRHVFDKPWVLSAATIGRLCFGFFFSLLPACRRILQIALTDIGSFGFGRLDVRAGDLSGLTGHTQQQYRHEQTQ